MAMRFAVLLTPFVLLSCAADTNELLPSPGAPDAQSAPEDVGPAPGSGPDLGTDAGVQRLPPSFSISYEDLCDCGQSRCCPSMNLRFDPGDEAHFFFICGDAIECPLPPISWEVQDTRSLRWFRLYEGGPSSTGGWQCAPDTITDITNYSIPFPPGGKIRAVALFDTSCGRPGSCDRPCGEPFEVTSNELMIPYENDIDGSD